MKWRKLYHWLPEIPGFTHAAMPTYFRGRVYFSPRDNFGRSHIYSASLDLSRMELKNIREDLTPGQPGDFDDAGCMVCDVREELASVHIYFIGWNLGVSVPFRNSLGLVKGYNKLHGPIKDRSRYDPCGVGSCWEGTRWYLSVMGWHLGKPRYHIVNGDHSLAITFKNPCEHAIARPCVMNPTEPKSPNYFNDHLYRMWYCYRGEQYRIGYAESKDGLSWTRKDEEVGIDVSESGFDNEATCYPNVFPLDGSLYMLYNGNAYGKTGIGLAVLDA